MRNGFASAGALGSLFSPSGHHANPIRLSACLHFSTATCMRCWRRENCCTPSVAGDQMSASNTWSTKYHASVALQYWHQRFPFPRFSRKWRWSPGADPHAGWYGEGRL